MGVVALCYKPDWSLRVMTTQHPVCANFELRFTSSWDSLKPAQCTTVLKCARKETVKSFDFQFDSNENEKISLLLSHLLWKRVGDETSWEGLKCMQEAPQQNHWNFQATRGNAAKTVLQSHMYVSACRRIVVSVHICRDRTTLG